MSTKYASTYVTLLLESVTTKKMLLKKETLCRHKTHTFGAQRGPNQVSISRKERQIHLVNLVNKLFAMQIELECATEELASVKNAHGKRGREIKQSILERVKEVDADCYEILARDLKIRTFSTSGFGGVVKTPTREKAVDVPDIGDSGSCDGESSSDDNDEVSTTDNDTDRRSSKKVKLLNDSVPDDNNNGVESVTKTTHIHELIGPTASSVNAGLKPNDHTAPEIASNTSVCLGPPALSNNRGVDAESAAPSVDAHSSTDVAEMAAIFEQDLSVSDEDAVDDVNDGVNSFKQSLSLSDEDAEDDLNDEINSSTDTVDCHTDSSGDGIPPLPKIDRHHSTIQCLSLCS